MMQGPYSVSYTHLDVYKRQEQALENANSKLDQYADALTAAGSRMKAAFNDNPGSVSYTHLDVYKRQVQRSAPRYELEKVQAWLESRMKKGGTDK